MVDFILSTDSYKYSHASQYLPDTEGVYSYLESRKGSKYPCTVFYGLQELLIRRFEGAVVTRGGIDRAEALVNAHLGPGVFKRELWEHILDKHGGHLPLRIRALPEGTAAPTGTALMTVENTDPACAWLTNFAETLLTHVWYTCTVATLSHVAHGAIRERLLATTDDEAAALAGLPFMLHNFSARGVENLDAAASGAAAHLLSFLGTDNVMGLTIPQDYYGEPSSFCAGYSVRATEHSVMTSRGEAGEWDVVQSILERNPEGILSLVIDSYDYRRFLHTMGTRFKDAVLARNGRTVFRPDSGDYRKVAVDCLDILAERFGARTNSKGYRVLPDCVRVLWGDGINLDGVLEILDLSAKAGYAAENWVFGMGGGLMQTLNRDVMRMATKCSAQRYGGAWHDVWKRPLDASKASKRGRLAVVEADGTLATVREEDVPKGTHNLLEVVFEDGEIKRRHTFTEIRRRLGDLA